MTLISSWRLLLCLVTIVSAASKSSSRQVESASTCPYRTVNYITHNLPQQCLASSRSHTSTSADAVTASATSTSLAPSEHSTEKETTSSISTVTPTTNLIPYRPSQPVETTVNDIVVIHDVIEEDSELNSGNFLSFEEWKKQNLKKAGQPEHIGRRGQEDQELRKRPANVQNSLETLGEDGEIDIDFSGFVPGGPDQITLEKSQPLSDNAGEGHDEENSPKVKKRNKDAGTTCKERFNYASFDCAANILKFNKGAKNPNAVLLENKDSYMLNQCVIKDKYMILELCDDILIDTIVLANFEFFSSTFRTFRVSVSDKWPVKPDKWRILGTYEAHNTRQVQAFLVENPLIWARYVRIEFLTHYGNEYYCPLSLIRIHGITMIEEWKSGEDSAFDHDVEDGEQSQQEDARQATSSIEAAATLSEIPPKNVPEAEFSTTSDVKKSTQLSESLTKDVSSHSSETTSTPASVIAMEAIMSVIESSDVCTPTEKSANTHADETQSSSIVTQTHEPSPARSANTPQTIIDTHVSRVADSKAVTVTTATSQSVSKNGTDDKSLSVSVASSSVSIVSQPSSKTSSEKAATTTTSKSKISSTPAVEKPKSPSSSASPQPAVPATQESFFKTVQKRLQMLETNSSLSLQYIEDQSRSLRDAFKKVEQRQLSRTTTFLEQLNQTVLYELREFRQQYDQLWQSTVIELEMQRERYQRDNEAIHARISILADEVIFQRRMAVLQMILVLVCLALVLFSRGSINNYLELPIVQNVLARSPSARWLNLSTDSLLRPTPPSRVRSAQQLRAERSGILKGHRRLQSEDSITDTQSGNELYAPPTPISDYGHSEVELGRDDGKSPIESDKDGAIFEDPEFDPSTIERPATSPPMLRVDDAAILTPDTETSGEDSLNARLSHRAQTLSNGDGAAELALPESSVPVKRLSWKLPDR